MSFEAKICIYLAGALRRIAGDCRDKYFDVIARLKEGKNPPLIASGNLTAAGGEPSTLLPQPVEQNYAFLFDFYIRNFFFRF